MIYATQPSSDRLKMLKQVNLSLCSRKRDGMTDSPSLLGHRLRGLTRGRRNTQSDQLHKCLL